MHATAALEERDTTDTTARDAAARRMRASDELYDFRRYNYADGWDSDDAALGWVDDEIVSAKSRRLH